MMRFIEHGKTIRMVETAHETHAVDTEQDLQLVAELMETDPLIAEY